MNDPNETKTVTLGDNVTPEVGISVGRPITNVDREAFERKALQQLRAKEHNFAAMPARDLCHLAAKGVLTNDSRIALGHKERSMMTDSICSLTTNEIQNRAQVAKNTTGIETNRSALDQLSIYMDDKSRHLSQLQSNYEASVQDATAKRGLILDDICRTRDHLSRLDSYVKGKVQEFEEQVDCNNLDTRIQDVVGNMDLSEYVDLTYAVEREVTEHLSSCFDPSDWELVTESELSEAIRDALDDYVTESCVADMVEDKVRNSIGSVVGEYLKEEVTTEMLQELVRDEVKRAMDMRQTLTPEMIREVMGRMDLPSNVVPPKEAAIQVEHAARNGESVEFIIIKVDEGYFRINPWNHQVTPVRKIQIINWEDV